jgi:hypothetical protein
MVVGERSRKATLMNMYEEPQIADNATSSGRYERLTRASLPSGKDVP